MSLLHIIGFGARFKLKLEARCRWYPEFPDTALAIEPGDAIILNLIEIHDAKAIEKAKRVVDFIGQNGGILVVVSAPFKSLSRGVSNYHFLPWPDHIIKGIQTQDDFSISAASKAPSWAKWFVRRFDKNLVAPAFFGILPSGAHVLMTGSYGHSLCVSYKHVKGRILILPSIQPIIHGEFDSSAKNLLTAYLEYLGSEILVRFEELSKPAPEWLNSIMIRNESKLKTQYETLGRELQTLYEEKSILADDGHSLTRKVASLLEWLGFQAVEKESIGYQDIEISEGEFRAVIECTGSIGYFNIDKVRQLLEYIAIEEEAKGIFIGNPWKDKHPKNRDLHEAFTDRAIERARRLGVCLVTVPHLYRVCLDNQSDDEKARVRASLQNCEGLWQYPASDWI